MSRLGKLKTMASKYPDQLESNLFIRSLEFGERNFIKGTTYLEMIAHLRAQKIEIPPLLDQYYKIWFFRNFYVYKVHPESINDFEWTIANKPAWLDEHLEKKAVLTASAYFEYLEFIEINEARKNSKDAKNLSLWAIGISIFFAIIQLIIGIIQIIPFLKSLSGK